MNLLKHNQKTIKTSLHKFRSVLAPVLKFAAVFVLGLLINQARHYYVSVKTKNNQWYTVNADAGEKSRITLPDGTEVWLNSESQIRFSATDFNYSRKLELTGEAYFKVVKNEKLPFVVKTNDYIIEVLGTEFNVMAYNDFNRTETTLVSGLVKITRGKQSLVLKPSQTLVYSDNTFSLKSGQVEQAVSWKEGKFYFDAIPFKELVTRLERWYNVDITIDDPKLGDRIYSGVFKNEETIWQVLDVIERNSPIRYERPSFRKIVLYSKNEADQI